jgi:hypothetical protein
MFIGVWGLSCFFSIYKVVDKMRVVLMTLVKYLDTVVNTFELNKRNKIRCSSKRKERLNK